MKIQILKALSLVFPLMLISSFFVMLILALIWPANDIPSVLKPLLIFLFLIALISVIGIWFFIIYEIIHIVKNRKFSDNAKAGWIFAVWFLNIFVIPIYAYKYFE